jgi:hypothetical protein
VGWPRSVGKVLRRLAHSLVVFGLLGVATTYLVAWRRSGWLALESRVWEQAGQAGPSMDAWGPLGWQAQRYTRRGGEGVWSIYTRLMWIMYNPVSGDGLTPPPLNLYDQAFEDDRQAPRAAEVVPWWAREMVHDPRDPPDRRRQREEIEWCVAAGWPWLAVTASSVIGPDVARGGRMLTTSSGVGWLRAMPNEMSPDDVVLLPLVPMWPGFVLDTVVFGAGWWVVAAGVVGTRRLMRQSAGRCGACGYDLRGGAGACPECGASWDGCHTPSRRVVCASVQGRRNRHKRPG